jgi:hypothetical protein
LISGGSVPKMSNMLFGMSSEASPPARFDTAPLTAVVPGLVDLDSDFCFRGFYSAFATGLGALVTFSTVLSAGFDSTFWIFG